MIELTQTQKEELVEVVEGVALKTFERQELAKEDLSTIAKAAEETFGVKPPDFKKIVKLLYNSTFNEEKAKSSEFIELYEGLLS